MSARLVSAVRIAATAGLVAVWASSPVLARVGGGFSGGSRGSRTYSAPAPTYTAPRTAQPMQRTETPSFGTSRPGGFGSGAAAPRRFGFGTGLVAGLFGAGLLGMLTGHGFFGGLAGLASLFGLLVQVGLIVGLVWLALRFFRRRSEPAFAGPGAAYGRSPLGAVPPVGGGMPGRGPSGGEALQIQPADYQAFERALTDVQLAYSREDVATLARLATPEMVRYFQGDLEASRRDGVRNELRDPKLLQGDLSEAWREGTTDYATVAMRFSLIDVMVDRATGRVVSGDPARPGEVTELWTFARDRGGPWTLSAIQQVN